DIVRRLARFRPDVVMTSHVGSTQAHPCCLRLLRSVKAALPGVVTVYGGVHPTYHYQDILAGHAEVAVIVRGEGAATALDPVQTLAKQPATARDLSGVPGIAWRHDGHTIANPHRAAIDDLDGARTGRE